MGSRAKAGTLVVIGGAESKKDGAAEILRFVAERVGTGRLVVMTCATEDPDAAWDRYRTVFLGLGVRKIEHLDVRDRGQALDERESALIEGAAGVFFTGGDQLRTTSHIGDTPVYRRIMELRDGGGVVAGTSAGATVMSETMLVDGESANTPRVGDIVRMAPGLGLLPGIVVDMHFSERGRIGRLLGAIAQNPRMLGVGVDEDTAMVVEGDVAEVIGSGGLYILDGSRAYGGNVAEGAQADTLAIENVTLHVLNQGRRFDLATRRPVPDPTEGAATSAKDGASRRSKARTGDRTRPRPASRRKPDAAKAAAR